MQALNVLVTSGKVLYLGISDTPAWVVSKANQFARCNNLAPFVYANNLEFDEAILTFHAGCIKESGL